MMSVKSHVPNWLTYSRILIVPLLVWAVLARTPGGYQVALGLFIYASVTDFLDGYLARRWNAASGMGRLLDPIADKMVVAGALLALLPQGIAPVWPSALIIFRELFVCGLREFLIERRVALPVSRLAKYKTAAQCLAVTVLLAAAATGSAYWLQAGGWLLWAACALTLWTGLAYFNASLKTIRAV